MKVLVTGAGALLGQGIIRSLRWSELNPHIIAADPSPHAVGLQWADEGVRIPLATDPAFLDSIDGLLQRHRPDAVLCGTDVELSKLAEARSVLESAHATKVLVSSSSVIEIADDKYRTYQFLSDAGFDPPQSCLPGDVERLIASCGFPLVVKPRRGARSVGVQVVEREPELRAAIEAVDDPVIQECVSVDGHEFTAGALLLGDWCRSIIMRRDLRDGNTYRAFVDKFPRENEQIERVARKLQPFGPANFQFCVQNDRCRIFEINARFSGTTPFRARVGFNEVELLLRYAVLEQKPPATLEITPATILRYWDELVLPRGS